jgi:ABC-type phosphate/phosphonate transport system substrate-binding protein
MIANARMYSVAPKVAALWRQLLESIGKLARMDLEVVTHAAPKPLAELWQRQDKAAVFMCGLPFALGTFAAQLLAAPVPSPPAFKGQPRYWSALVVRRDSDFRTLADTFGHRMALTAADSQSGHAAPLDYLRKIEGPFPRFSEIIAPQITPLGALSAVLAGVADLAPIDSYAFALLEKYRPELTSQVRCIAQTESTPIPALISSPRPLAGLQEAFLAAHELPELQPIMQGLLLERFVLPDPAAYDTLRTMFEQSKAYWRRHPLASVVHPVFV